MDCSQFSPRASIDFPCDLIHGVLFERVARQNWDVPCSSRFLYFFYFFYFSCKTSTQPALAEKGARQARSTRPPRTKDENMTNQQKQNLNAPSHTRRDFGALGRASQFDDICRSSAQIVGAFSRVLVVEDVACRPGIPELPNRLSIPTWYGWPRTVKVASTDRLPTREASETCGENSCLGCCAGSQ